MLVCNDNTSDGKKRLVAIRAKLKHANRHPDILKRVDVVAAAYVDAWGRQSRMSASGGALRIAKAARALTKAAEALDLFTRARASVLLGGDYAEILTENCARNAWLGRVLEGVAKQARQNVTAKRARHVGNPALRAFVADLAMIYTDVTGRRAAASVNPHNGNVSGPFVSFVLACHAPVTAMFPMIRTPTPPAIRVMLKSTLKKI